MSALTMEATRLCLVSQVSHYQIKGADKKTGVERVIVVNAGSEEEARLHAAGRGLLVESLSAGDDPHGLTSTAAILKTLGSVGMVIGGFGAVLGAFLLLAALEQQPPAENAIMNGASSIIAGVFLIGLGAILKMLAAIGLTLRDISRKP